MKALIRFIMCSILDLPLVTKIGDYRSSLGDYADEFSVCDRCGKYVHRDMHMYGDGKWRHE